MTRTQQFSLLNATYGVTVPAAAAAVRRRAARSVAHHAADAGECVALLDMLGLSVHDGVTPREESP